MYAIKIIHFHGLLLILFLQLSDRKFSVEQHIKLKENARKTSR